jgi:O-methyltransferase involved in polyketide biosynthesis
MTHLPHLCVCDATPSDLAIDAGVHATMLIPLAARACGDALFPSMACHDAFAAEALQQIGTNVTPFLKDRPSIFGVLSRTRIFKALASAFFGRFPHATGASLGCGLSCYFQWLDCRTNRWLDVDLPEVMRLRKRILPGSSKRHHHATADLARRGWWDRLKLPRGHGKSPVVLICEGLLMYFRPDEIRRFLQEFGENAPPGSELLCDTLSWHCVGAAAAHPSVGYTHAEFRWGPRYVSDFTEPHPRLVVRSEHPVMDHYDLAYAAMFGGYRALWGVSLYGITRIGVED